MQRSILQDEILNLMNCLSALIRILVSGRDEILDLVAKLHKERNLTVILVSHSMEDVARYVERLIVMNQDMIRMK